MKILIIGAGEVGFHLTQRLSKEGHDIHLIESVHDRFEEIKDKLDAHIHYGSGTNAELLETARINDTELFIAVSSIDEVNIMSCMIAKEYGVPRKIARAINSDYTTDESRLNGEKLGIEKIINPQNEVANEIVELCEFTDAAQAAEFFDGELLYLGYPVKEENPHIGKPFFSLATLGKEQALVISCIQRDDEIFIPTKDDTIQEKDIIYFFCEKKNIKMIRDYFEVKAQAAKKIFVLGAGKIGLQVISKLNDSKHQIKVFDRDREVCKRVDSEINGVDVFCTDGSDIETFKEEGIKNVDVFISTLGDDEGNILASLMAKKLGAKRAIALVNKADLRNLAYSLGIDSTVSPRLATASNILKYIRRGNIISVIQQAHDEILEIEISPKSSIIKKPIKDLNRPDGVMFGAVERGGQIKLLGGDDFFYAHDKVVAFALKESVAKLEAFFEI